MRKPLLALVFLAANTQSAELMEVAQMLALSQGVALEEHQPPKPRDCADPVAKGEGEKESDARAQVKMSFEVKAISGLKGNQQKRFIDYRQDGFEDKWDKLISATDSSSRKAVMKDICSDMNQDGAIAFAGYMGSKNGRIYDYRRMSSGDTGEDQYLNEIITMDAYYETHRNNEGLGDNDGRKKMGVCGDSAAMVAEFLSNCGFSCNDIDIVSYRTMSGGHQMVSARGESGEFYTANWSEATDTSNASLLQYQTPDPNLTMTSPIVSTFSCEGKPKGHTTTPLGTLLMMAHEDSHTLNFGHEYNELAFVIENLGGVDEIKLKAFRGKANNGQSVQGIGANASAQFGENNGLFVLETRGSIILAQAQRDIEQSEGQITDLSQDIFSTHASARLNFNALRMENLNAGLFLEADATTFIFDNKTTVNGVEETGSNGDAMIRQGFGVMASGKKDNFRFSAEAGMRAFLERNTSQKGGTIIDGKKVERKYTVIPNQVFLSGEFAVEHNKNGQTVLALDYRNAFLMGQTRVDLTLAHQYKDAKISGGVSIIKNPKQETINALSLGLSKGFKIRDNYVELNGGVQYLIIENLPNDKNLNVTVAYRFK